MFSITKRNILHALVRQGVSIHPTTFEVTIISFVSSDNNLEGIINQSSSSSSSISSAKTSSADQSLSSFDQSSSSSSSSSFSMPHCRFIEDASYLSSTQIYQLAERIRHHLEVEISSLLSDVIGPVCVDDDDDYNDRDDDDDGDDDDNEVYDNEVVDDDEVDDYDYDAIYLNQYYRTPLESFVSSYYLVFKVPFSHSITVFYCLHTTYYIRSMTPKKVTTTTTTTTTIQALRIETPESHRPVDLSLLQYVLSVLNFLDI